jgi:hypothetical protein
MMPDFDADTDADLAASRAGAPGATHAAGNDNDTAGAPGGDGAGDRGGDRGGQDLFALGRRAAQACRRAHGGRGFFTRSRQLLGTGAWRGPRDAPEALVEEEDLAALGGLAAAQALGARTLLATSAGAARAALAAGMRVLWRLPFRAGEPEAERHARFQDLAALGQDAAIDGVIPTPAGEPMGLDTLAVMVRCRLQLPVAHVVADFVRLGHRLAQMSLGFGADELYGPIMPERALRLGANAHNPVMTRKEAAVLLRGAGLTPCERLSGGALEEVAP